MNKAMIESYLRNLLQALVLAVTVVMGSTGIVSPLDFGLGEWLLVANALWTPLIPTLIRWANKKDPAFGLIATAVTASVTKKLEEATEAAKPAPKKATPKKQAELKAKPAPKKKSGGGGDASPQQFQ